MEGFVGRTHWIDRALIERAAMLAIIVLPGCSNPIDGLFTQPEWTRIQTLSPLPALPADPTNAVGDDAAAARLGQMLFFESDYSGPIITGDDGSNGGLGAAGQ